MSLTEKLGQDSRGIDKRGLECVFLSLSFSAGRTDLPLVDPDRYEVRVHELCPDRAQDLVLPVLDQAELPSVEDHADGRVLKVELLVAARGRPLDLGQEVP